MTPRIVRSSKRASQPKSSVTRYSDHESTIASESRARRQSSRIAGNKGAIKTMLTKAAKALYGPKKSFSPGERRRHPGETREGQGELCVEIHDTFEVRHEISHLIDPFTTGTLRVAERIPKPTDSIARPRDPDDQPDDTDQQVREHKPEDHFIEIRRLF